MFRPTAGELIAGIADSLRETVLPSVSGGAAQRQLKAALHALGRLQRSWDRLPRYLADDNADLQQTLDSTLTTLIAELQPLAPAVADLRARLLAQGAADAPPLPGINDPALARAGRTNEALQALLADLDHWLRQPTQRAQAPCARALQTLESLYRRMVERELTAWATQADED